MLSTSIRNNFLVSLIITALILSVPQLSAGAGPARELPPDRPPVDGRLADAWRLPMENAVMVQPFGVHPEWWKKYSFCYATDYANLFHAGEDWAARGGSPVYAAANGIVEWYNPWYNTYPGRIVILRHQLPDGSQVYSMYGHLDNVEVIEGQTVSIGTQIGTILNQGYNSHLHWEIRDFADGSFICNFRGGPGYTYPHEPEHYGYTNPSAFVARQNSVSFTAGRVLDHQGRLEVDPPPNTTYLAEPIRPGEVRQAEQYWGMQGIDYAGPRPGSCENNADATYLAGWHLGDLVEYRILFPDPNARYRLTIVGQPDDPAPIDVTVAIDGKNIGKVVWAGSDPRCNVSEEIDAARIEIRGYQGEHALTLRFANDTYTCSGGHADACDRNFWLDYLVFEELGPISSPTQSGRTPNLRGTIIGGSGQVEPNLFVSAWRHDGGQFVSTYTDQFGFFEFSGLNPNQRYNLVVNARWVGLGGDCNMYERIDQTRQAASRDNVQLTDGGDGWHSEDFLLTSRCP